MGCGFGVAYYRHKFRLDQDKQGGADQLKDMSVISISLAINIVSPVGCAKVHICYSCRVNDSEHSRFSSPIYACHVFSNGFAERQDTYTLFLGIRLYNLLRSKWYDFLKTDCEDVWPRFCEHQREQIDHLTYSGISAGAGVICIRLADSQIERRTVSRKQPGDERLGRRCLRSVRWGAKHSKIKHGPSRSRSRCRRRPYIFLWLSILAAFECNQGTPSRQTLMTNRLSRASRTRSCTGSKMATCFCVLR